ncbi:D-Ala-D-Ala carboxypeptidase family metallohydrolase [Phyllobacterium sp. YR531]|uniref:D-Ala-D-Ala carboxypeptidase family metallohydrolase n=1 Tax=Phyllobacterium sp. YR531 TaxID=1144343 RepID=UPI0009DA54EA|nr:D-Ala-D-Ala carboxypeptidase family metallohydrolase [Phyllobacterium sp. YR531]
MPRSVSALRASTVVCVIGLVALAATSCTSTGTNPGVTSALAVAPTDTSAGDTQTSLPSGGNAQVTPEALALAGSTETNALQAINGAAKPAEGKAELAKADAKAEAQGSTETKTEEVQVASAATVVAQPPVRTSLFGSMAKKADPAPTPAVEAPEAADTAKPEAKAAPDTAAAEAPPPEETKTAAAPQKNNGALLRLFSNNRSKPAGQRLVAVIEPKSKPTASGSSEGDLPSADSFAGRTEHLASLPGVRPNAGIQIMQRDSLYEDDDIEAAGAPVILASAAGLARLAPNGLKVQRESVDVACLKPQLVGILKLIERKYGKSVIVTSGYRSPPYNRKVNGAKASLHMSCAAADIQVPGISKWELANYARAMTGRGGVGTYCHTESVHVDIGPRRDWNWRCSRGKG